MVEVLFQSSKIVHCLFAFLTGVSAIWPGVSYVNLIGGRRLRLPVAISSSSSAYSTIFFSAAFQDLGLPGVHSSGMNSMSAGSVVLNLSGVRASATFSLQYLA